MENCRAKSRKSHRCPQRERLSFAFGVATGGRRVCAAAGWLAAPENLDRNISRVARGGRRHGYGVKIPCNLKVILKFSDRRGA
jgi:hypothetical protein